MSALLDSDSPQLKLVAKWHRGFMEKNIDLLGEQLHKDFRRCTYPRSLNKPEQNREEWLKHFGGVIQCSTSFESDIHSVVEAPGKVIIHATNDVKNQLGVKMTRESIFILDIVPGEDGALMIKQVDEFTDSKTYLDVAQAMSAAKQRAKE